MTQFAVCKAHLILLPQEPAVKAAPRFANKAPTFLHVQLCQQVELLQFRASASRRESVSQKEEGSYPTEGNDPKSRGTEGPPEPGLIQHSGWSIRSRVKSGRRHFAFRGCQHILRCHVPPALHLAHTCALLLAAQMPGYRRSFSFSGLSYDKLVSLLISQSEHPVIHCRQNNLQEFKQPEEMP